MSTNPEGDSPHDGSTDTEQRHDSEAAVAIARERLTDEVDPRAHDTAADRLGDVLARVADDLEDDSLREPTLYDACVHLDRVEDVLRDISHLHGWGWESRDETERERYDREAAPDE